MTQNTREARIAAALDKLPANEPMDYRQFAAQLQAEGYGDVVPFIRREKELGNVQRWIVSDNGETRWLIARPGVSRE